MFSLLVAGNGEMWESSPFTFHLGRFHEYSGTEALASIDIARPETLLRLEELPTLLMYEVGVGTINARVVRHGRLRNIARRANELTFLFDPDPQQAFLDRSNVLAFSEQLGIAQFEQHRTHWAIKDGDIPAELIATATPEPIQRSVAVVATQYVEAKRLRHRTEIIALEGELAAFSPSIEKAMALLPSRIISQPTPELYPILGIEPKTAEGRNALNAVLLRDAEESNLPDDWSFSLAWFLALYGSATERSRLNRAIEACAQQINALSNEDPGQENLIERIGYTLWRCSRSEPLVGNLRKEIAVLINQLIRRQTPAGYWSDSSSDNTPKNIRATALATVALQRLGDDRYHDAIKRAIGWLLTNVLPDSLALPHMEAQANPDVLTTVLTMEAIRRSDEAGGISHVLEEGDSWLVAAQNDLGAWEVADWPDEFLTGVVLEYLSGKNQILAQVDGFLLMARDFFRKAEELRLENGANNRRLAAIATVHSVEMFLYGLFERREDLALSAFKENGTETLGPREALRALQDALQRIGFLPPPKRLPYRDKLSSLIGRRDGIIHRAHEVSEAELSSGMRDARSFINYFAKELLNLDLLQ